MVLLGKVTRHTAAVCPTRLALQLQQRGLAAVPAAARRERPAERGERDARQAVAALLVAPVPRRQVRRLVAAVALVRVKQPALARRRGVAPAGRRRAALQLLAPSGRAFHLRLVELAVARWQRRRAVGYDLNEGRVEARRDEHRLCGKRAINRLRR